MSTPYRSVLRTVKSVNGYANSARRGKPRNRRNVRKQTVFCQPFFVSLVYFVVAQILVATMPRCGMGRIPVVAEVTLCTLSGSRPAGQDLKAIKLDAQASESSKDQQTHLLALRARMPGRVKNSESVSIRRLEVKSLRRSRWQRFVLENFEVLHQTIIQQMVISSRWLTRRSKEPVPRSHNSLADIGMMRTQ